MLNLYFYWILMIFFSFAALTECPKINLIFLKSPENYLKFFFKQILMLPEMHSSAIKSWLKRDTETTDRHTGRGKGCRVWCPAWRRGRRLPLCWTETSCLCAAPAWLRARETKIPWMQREDRFSTMSKALSDSSFFTCWVEYSFRTLKGT